MTDEEFKEEWEREITQLRGILKKQYRFGVTKYRIPITTLADSKAAVARSTSQLARNYGDERNLIILYYSGHACYTADGEFAISRFV